MSARPASTDWRPRNWKRNRRHGGFLEGASGSTHNITLVPVAEAVVRMKRAVKQRGPGHAHPVNRAQGDPADDEVPRPPLQRRRGRRQDRPLYDALCAGGVRPHPAGFRRHAEKAQGQAGRRTRNLRAGAADRRRGAGRRPGRILHGAGPRHQKRSPFKHTYVAELANDWIGYLPDREGHRLGGYQTWMGLHSYAEVGTGERVADLAVELLNELAAGENKQSAMPRAGPVAKAVDAVQHRRERLHGEKSGGRTETVSIGRSGSHDRIGCRRTGRRQPGRLGLGCRRPSVRGGDGRLSRHPAQRPHQAIAGQRRRRTL